MTGPPDDPPEAQRLNDFYEVAVDGRTIFRMEEISTLQQSPVDDAVIAYILSEASQSLADDLEAEHGKPPEEIIEDADPLIEEFDSDVGEWE